MVELQESYVISSNRESGLCRYDIMLEPRGKEGDAYIIEFKVVHAGRKESLEGAVRAAAAILQSRGIEPGRIKKYGFAFEGSKVLIGMM